MFELIVKINDKGNKVNVVTPCETLDDLKAAITDQIELLEFMYNEFYLVSKKPWDYQATFVIQTPSEVFIDSFTYSYNDYENNVRRKSWSN